MNWKLTRREEHVLLAMIEGLCCKGTARKLTLTEKTVKHYRTTLFAKMNAKNAPHAVALAFQTGFVKVPAPEPVPAQVQTVVQQGMFWSMGLVSNRS